MSPNWHPFVAISICHNANLMKNVEPCSRPTQKYIPMGQAHSKPLPWSNSTSAQYLTLQIENWMKKSQNMLVWLSKMVLALKKSQNMLVWLSKMVLALFAAACTRHSKSPTPAIEE
jgi:hypothetical protein